MGGGTQQTQQTNSSPWGPQQDYLKTGFAEAKNLYDSGPQEYFPGQTYADFTPQQTAGLGMAENVATSGNPVINNAAGYVSNTLGGNSDNPYAGILGSGAHGTEATASGDFLNNNPWLDKTYDAASRKLTDSFSNTVMPGIAAQFGLNGMTDSTGHELATGTAAGNLTDSLSSLAADIYGGDYAAERGRMADADKALLTTGSDLYGKGISERLGALSQAPGIREAQFGDAQHLQDVGAAYQGQNTKEIEDAINRFNYDQQAPYAALQDYMAMIQGNYGGTSVSRSSVKGNPLMQGLGTALSVAAML
jgi:hypothetical protein